MSRKMVLSNLLGRKYRWIIVTVGLILGLTSLPALAASNTITPNNGILNVCQGTVCNNTGYQSFTPLPILPVVSKNQIPAAQSRSLKF